MEQESSGLTKEENYVQEPTTSSVDPHIYLEEAETRTPTSNRKKSRVLALPWIVMLIALYAFTLPWINFAIVQRYFLKPDWGAALPGLNSTPYRKITMRAHMATGAICLLLGPLQFIRRVRTSYPRIHKWSGRIYCVCAMASCVFGLAFIALKRRLVGGYNMSFAFAAAGLTIGILSLKAWQTARAAKVGVIPDFTPHRNWGIRSYSQILAPMLYRYWYIGLQLFNIYKVPITPQLGGFCRSDDVCPDYLRIFDMVHCWTYWLTALGVAELIIYYLPKHEHISTLTTAETSTIILSNEQDSQMPLLLARRPLPSNDEDPLQVPIRSIKTPSPMAINAIGWVLAAVAVSITTKIYTYKGPA